MAACGRGTRGVWRCAGRGPGRGEKAPRARKKKSLIRLPAPHRALAAGAHSRRGGEERGAAREGASKGWGAVPSALAAAPRRKAAALAVGPVGSVEPLPFGAIQKASAVERSSQHVGVSHPVWPLAAAPMPPPSRGRALYQAAVTHAGAHHQQQQQQRVHQGAMRVLPGESGGVFASSQPPSYGHQYSSQQWSGGGSQPLGSSNEGAHHHGSCGGQECVLSWLCPCIMICARTHSRIVAMMRAFNLFLLLNSFSADRLAKKTRCDRMPPRALWLACAWPAEEEHLPWAARQWRHLGQPLAQWPPATGPQEGERP